MSDPVYCYPPDHTVLRNKFDIDVATELEVTEREYSTFRIEQGCPAGDFDLDHLKAIHGHIFQDVYPWAGELRTVELRKPGSQFMFRQFIETGMADVHRRVVASDYLKGTSPSDFSDKAGEIIGDINHIHPFREGNGRTQLQYLSQLADQAGHKIDLGKLEPRAWIEASVKANEGDYTGMRDCIHDALETEREQDRPQVSAKEYAQRFREARDRAVQMQNVSENEIE